MDTLAYPHREHTDCTKGKVGPGLFCPYLSVPDHDHADKDNVDVGSQGVVVVDFIYLRTARGHEIINLTNQTEEREPRFQHTDPQTAVTLKKKDQKNRP